MRLNQFARSFAPFLLVCPLLASSETTIFAFGTDGGAKEIMPRLQNFAEEIAEKSDYNWISLAAVLGDKLGRIEPFNLDKANQFLDAGIKDFDLLNLESAISKLKKAEAYFHQSLTAIRSLEPLARTYLYLGLASHLQTHDSLARAYISQAFAFDQAILEKKMHLLPSQKKLVDAIKKNQSALEKKQIQFRTSPPNAALRIDGVFGFNQKSQWVRTSSSQHLIQASLAGYISQARLIQYGATKDALINLTLAPAPKKKLLDKLALQLSSNLESPKENPATVLDVDEVLWLGGSRSGQALTVYAGFAEKGVEIVPSPQFRVFLTDRPTFLDEFKLWVQHLLKQNRLAKKAARTPNPNWIEPQAKLWIKSEPRPAIGQSILAYSGIPLGAGIGLGIVKGALPTNTSTATKSAWGIASNIGLIAGGAMAGLGIMAMLIERP